MKRALVTGAGGFIGNHLVRYLKQRGYWVRGVDIKRPEWSETAADEFWQSDLRQISNVYQSFWQSDRVPNQYHVPAIPFDEVYALAADMGGMGYISDHDADILRSNLLINLNTLEAARQARVGRYLFTSSACVYPMHAQLDTFNAGLHEDDAYPANPDTEYGWEKLTTERLCQSYARDYGMTTRIARLHNVYGPEGTWTGGREKAPAALCRKVAEAPKWIEHAELLSIDWTPVGPEPVMRGNIPHAEIEIWGDGEQTRSFLYIDDCLDGLYALMQSDYDQPVNIGSERLVTINELADIVGQAARVEVRKQHVEGPQGVRGRNSDSAVAREVLKWEPKVSLEDGITRTYAWIEAQVRAQHG